MIEPIRQPRAAYQQSESWRNVSDVNPIAQPRHAIAQFDSYKPLNKEHDNTCFGPSLGGNGWGGVGN
jgi:hypothetical protein